MDLSVFVVMLVSAAAQAGWNVILKVRLDPFSALVLVGICGGVAALLVVSGLALIKLF